MKLLQIHAEFMLPDDFEGTLADALALLSEYDRAHHSEAIANASRWKGHLDMTVKELQVEMLSDLLAYNKASGQKLVALYFCGEHII